MHRRATLERRAADTGDLTRSWSGPLTVRAAGDPLERIVEGTAVPFGRVATVRDTPGGPSYRETIARSAAEGIQADAVLLDYLTDPPTTYNTHQGSRLVGRGMSAVAGDDGLRMAFRVANTPAGDELLELARAGILTDMSIAFRPLAERRLDDGTIERTSIDLRRVTIVERGAYTGAQVTAVRAAQEGNMHCPDCGARLTPGVGHTCAGTRNRAAGANTSAAAAGDTSADDELEDGATTGAATSSSGGERPNRTRITVDVERAIGDAVAVALERAGVARPAEPTTRARATAERDTVAGFSRGAGGSRVTITRPEFIYGPGSGRSFFGDLWRASQGGGGEADEARGRVERHYALLEDVDRVIQRALGFDHGATLARAGDVLSSEIPGAYPSEYLPGLIVNRVLKQRPMGGFYQRFPLEDGRPRIYPVVSTSTTVAVQASEGANPAASDFATTGTTVTPLFYGGETAVSRQVLDGADPSTDVMLQTDLDEAYMQASETVIKTAVEAGSTASGVVLTAATPDAGLRALIINFLGTVFLPAERVFLPTTLTNSWLTQNDTTGRPLAPSINPTNSAGVADVGGLPLIGQLVTTPVAQSWASTPGAGAGVGGVAVAGRSSDFAIFESNVANFRFEEGAGAPASIRIGLWAYLVVGTRRGSRKATGA